MCNNYQKIGELDGFDLVECDECFKIALALPDGSFEPVHQCEMCDEFFRGEPVAYPDEDDSRHCHAQFCSDDCAHEAYEEVQYGYREAAEQYELYGDDLDSWYR